MSFPPFRCVITGHSSSTGKAVIESDAALHPVDPTGRLPSVNVYRTSGLVASNQGRSPSIGELQEDRGLARLPHETPTATTVRVLDFPPGIETPLHRTVSLDLGIILKGELVLILEDGFETTVRAGEMIVQRGTIHAWRNPSKEHPCRAIAVVMPAEKVKVGNEELEAKVVSSMNRGTGKL